MQTIFNKKLIKQYKSNSQKIRVLTEAWVGGEIFCPNCGQEIVSYENNRPVADFYCVNCSEEYELKSKKRSLGKKIVDGAYSTMIERLLSKNNPNFFFLNYDLKSYEVINFIVIPKHFFIPEIIEKRKPLSEKAQRSGWVGCNILLSQIPEAGKIHYIKNKTILQKDTILLSWKRTKFLWDFNKLEQRGWTIEVMKCIDRIPCNEFTLGNVYDFIPQLELKYPQNKHIKEKLRQQLQVLRDRHLIEFTARGVYKKIP